MDIPTEGVGSTLLTPQVGADSGLDVLGRGLHHVTEHRRAEGKVMFVGLEEESTTTMDVELQARGKKRKRNKKSKIYNWTRRLDD